MSKFDHIQRVLKSLVFGSLDLHQQCAIGLPDPQSEVTVWLNGMAAPRDVTSCNVMAAARPLTFGIGLEDGCDAAIIRHSNPSLDFRERSGENRLLGRIGLRSTEVVPVREGKLFLFETNSCENYCLPQGQLLARRFHHAYRNWRTPKHPQASDFQMLARELQRVFTFYICPRPVVLVSVADGNQANIFPMDLIGPIGRRDFSLAVHSTSAAVPLMEQSRRIALSSVPIEQKPQAYAMGMNHKRSPIRLARLPFPTVLSAAFRLPVPRFSLRVREMEINEVRTVGSHKLFLAHTVEDQQWAEGVQMHFVHGVYQARRLQALARSTMTGCCS